MKLPVPDVPGDHVIETPKAECAIPEKPLPPIPPRMNDWAKCELLTNPKSIENKPEHALSHT